MITHLPDIPNVIPNRSHRSLTKPYTVENSPETPPKVPNLEHHRPESGLSPFLNRITLKRPPEDNEQEPTQTMRSKVTMEEAPNIKKEVTQPKGNHKKSPKRRVTHIKAQRRKQMMNHDMETLMRNEQGNDDMGYGGCPETATGGSMSLLSWSFQGLRP